MTKTDNQIMFDITPGRHIRFLKSDYFQTTTKEADAIGIEWMIIGRELSDFLLRIGLKCSSDLELELKKRLKSDYDFIKKEANDIGKAVSQKERKTLIKDTPLRDRNIKVTVKLTSGRVREIYPTVNVIIPLDECNKKEERYYWGISVENGIEIIYKVLYWITATEISELKGAKTAEGILGKII